LALSDEKTTCIVQRCLDALDEAPAQVEAIRRLLDGAVGRLHKICGGMLHNKYPRLAQAPLNLSSEELLGGVVARLLTALRQARPADVRQFFALANQHIRWELNDLARRLDEQPNLQALPVELPAADSTGSGLSSRARRILAAIDGLPEKEREVFDLVRIQRLPHSETAELLGVSTKYVQGHLRRARVLLAERLHDLGPQ
jgi:RNA polymerase sigma-70 factor (ECF subfamily)